MDQAELEKRFPAVFARQTWAGGVSILGFTLSDILPPEDRVSSVNLVPFVGEDCIMIEATGLGPMVPGGTRDPGEELLDTAARELMEEAGARLRSWSPLGWWSQHSNLPTPYRPWLPHPDFLRLFLIGEVEIVSSPTQPDGGEAIERVLVLPAGEAAAWIEQQGRADIADLYRLAAHVRTLRTGNPHSGLR